MKGPPVAQPIVPPCEQSRIDVEPCPEALGKPPVPNRRLVLAACILASSMAFVDGSALTVALPALRADLGADLSAVQWVLNAYILALAGLTLAGGALADHFGRARVMAIGCAGFGVFSVLCAIAPDAGFLIAARLGQGAAAALLTPASLALIGSIYPKSERGAAIGAWAAASALTTAGGPLLGGWLTETFGWQAIFWINPPLAAVAIGLTFRFAPPEDVRPQRFDIPGAALLTAGLALGAFALSAIGPGEAATTNAHVDGSEESPAAATAGLMSIVALGGFIVWEKRASSPMAPPRLFQNRTFNGLNVSTLLIYAGLSIVFFIAPFDLVDRRGASATIAGAAFLPFTLSVGFLSRLFGGLADRIGGAKLLIAGSTVAALGQASFAAFQSAGLLLGVLLPMSILGVGFAMLVAPLTSSVLSAVDERDEGLASGVNNTASRIAQMVGVALAAAFAAFPGGFGLGAIAAAALSLIGAATIFIASRR